MLDIDNMTPEQMREALMAAEEAKKKKVSLKVSQKGCIQINGIRKFPFTFYVDEWKIIDGMRDEIAQFVEENEVFLSRK